MIVYYNIRLKSSPDLNFLQKRLGTPLFTDHRHEIWAFGKLQVISKGRNSPVGELIRFRNFREPSWRRNAAFRVCGG